RRPPSPTPRPHRCATAGTQPPATRSATPTSRRRRGGASPRPATASCASTSTLPRSTRSTSTSRATACRRAARPTTCPTRGRSATAPGSDVVDKAKIVTELDASRNRTLALLDPIPDDRQRAQVSELMSPLCWDLAHIGHYEELWLVRELTGAPPTERA